MTLYTFIVINWAARTFSIMFSILILFRIWSAWPFSLLSGLYCTCHALWLRSSSFITESNSLCTTILLYEGHLKYAGYNISTTPVCNHYKVTLESTNNTKSLWKCHQPHKPWKRRTSSRSYVLARTHVGERKGEWKEEKTKRANNSSSNSINAAISLSFTRNH